MENTAKFKPYDPDQLFLLPPDLRDWLPKDDLVFFLIDVVNELDLTPITSKYQNGAGGQPAYNPRMMVALLLYAYCMGTPSSRKIEQATYHCVAYRIVAGNQHPDHDTIASFRKEHLKALAGFFVDILKLCQKAGLVKLGHVALDGTKVKANASKHKAMSYGRMLKKEKQLKEQVNKLLKDAQTCDELEDARYGKGKRGDELPEELRYRESRLKKIQQAMQELKEEAQQEAREKEEKRNKHKKNKARGRPPKAPSGGAPDSKKQRNFTDPDSRIMKDSATKGFEQAYNCQAAVDESSQVIVAAGLTQAANDKEQIQPMVEQIRKKTGGKKPKRLTADTGYFSEDNCRDLAKAHIDAYIAVEKPCHGEQLPPAPRGRIPKNATIKERMARKLRTIKGRATYAKRKHIVEPVFGQIKELRGFRRFSLRGVDNVVPEWDLICLTHNLLKLFRSGWVPEGAG